MYKVGLDLERLRNINSGLGQYCYWLWTALEAQRNPALQYELYLPEDFSIARPNAPFHLVGFLDKLFGVRNSGLQLFHATHQDSHLLPHSKSIKNILTIHDLNFLEKYKKQPQKIKRRLAALQRKVDRCQAVTFISGYTEGVAREHLRFSEKQLLQTIFNGFVMPGHTIKERPAFLPDSEFFFSIGIIQTKKNFHVLLPLIKYFRIPWVLAGQKDSDYAKFIMNEAREAGIEHLVHMPGTIGEEEKYYCYQHCKAFFFPSLSEGFGIPVLEALSAGTPTFLSDRSSLPEVGGDYAFYWESFEADQMVAVVEEGLAKIQEDTSHAGKGQQWAAQFSWNKTAHAYEKLYVRLMLD